MSSGSSNLSSQVKVTVTDESGSSFPNGSFTGMYYLRNWNGGDTIRPYTLQRIPIPTAPFYWVRGRLVKSRKPIRFILKRRYEDSYRRPNNYTTSVNKRIQSVHQWWAGTTGQEYHSTTAPNVPVFPGHFTLVDSNRINKLVNKLGDRVRGHSFEAAVTISQLPMALRMIGESAVRIAMSMAHLRRGNFARAASIIGAPPPKKRIGDGIGARILEIQYGWRPLIDDVYNGAECVAAIMEHDRKVVYKVSTHVKSLVPKRNNAGITFRERTASHLYAITAYIKEGLGQQTFDVWDPAKVAWELTPYSFVADWAFPIGQYLEARGAASRLQGEFVLSDVSRRVCKGVTNDQPLGTLYGIKRFTAGLIASWEEIRFNRTTVSSLSSLPKMPVFKGWKKTLSWQHALNGVALLTTSKEAHPLSVLRRGGSLLKDLDRAYGKHGTSAV